MPQAATTKKPTLAQDKARLRAQGDHAERMNDVQADKLKMQGDHAERMLRVDAAKHKMAKEQHGMSMQAAAMDLATIDAQKDQEAHSKWLESGIDRDALKDVDPKTHGRLADVLGDKLRAILGKSHEEIVANGEEFKLTGQRSREINVGKVTKRSGKTSFSQEADTDAGRDRATKTILAGGGTPGTEKQNRRFGRRLAKPIKPVGKKKSSEPKTELKTESIQTRKSHHVWFTGTYVPFGRHHAMAVRETLEKYRASGAEIVPHIGITGKQVADPFQLPAIPSGYSQDEYLGHTMIAYNAHLKTNTPIELKMAVARAAHPDLAPHMQWVRDGMGKPAIESQDAPMPGDIVHNDTIYSQARGPHVSAMSGRAFNDQIGSPLLDNNDIIRHLHKSGLYVKSPSLITDEEGEKIGTTSNRMALIYAHSNRKNTTSPAFESMLNQRHAEMLGVDPGHAAIQHSKRMFDWMASGWDAIKPAAEAYYNQQNPMTEDRRHAAGVGERLLRAQSLGSVGKRIGVKPSPPTNENVLMKRSKRAARYDLRKKLAPNYHNMSTGQKQDIDERIAKHADFKRLVDSHYKEYKKKYAQKANTSSRNKKPEQRK